MPWTPPVTRAVDFFVSAAVWNTEHVDNLNYLREPHFSWFSSDVVISATTVGTAQAILPGSSVTYEAVPHMIEVFLPRLSSGDGALHVILKDGSTVVGTLLDGVAAASEQARMLGTRFTPTAAAHTFSVAAWRGGTTNWTARAGTGGVAGDATTFLNGWLRITRVAT